MFLWPHPFGPAPETNEKHCLKTNNQTNNKSIISQFKMFITPGSKIKSIRVNQQLVKLIILFRYIMLTLFLNS